MTQLELFLGLFVSLIYFILGYLVSRAKYQQRCRDGRHARVYQTNDHDEQFSHR